MGLQLIFWDQHLKNVQSFANCDVNKMKQGWLVFQVLYYSRKASNKRTVADTVGNSLLGFFNCQKRGHFFLLHTLQPQQLLPLRGLCSSIIQLWRLQTLCEPLQQPLKGHKRIGELADGGTMPVTSFPRRIIALMLLKCVIFVYDLF